MLSLGVSVSRGLVLPCLDDGKGVSTDFLAEITGNTPGVVLKQKLPLGIRLYQILLRCQVSPSALINVIPLY